MKKLIIALTLITSLSTSYAQKKETKKDTTTKQQTPDSLICITKRDLIDFTNFIRKNYSIEQYETIKPEQWLSELFIWKRQRVNQK